MNSTKYADHLYNSNHALREDIKELREELKAAEAEIDVLEMQVKIIPAPYADEPAMGDTLLKLKAAELEIERKGECMEALLASCNSGHFSGSHRLMCLSWFDSNGKVKPWRHSDE